jgi:hypothetical protein
MRLCRQTRTANHHCSLPCRAGAPMPASNVQVYLCTMQYSVQTHAAYARCCDTWPPAADAPLMRP